MQNSPPLFLIVSIMLGALGLFVLYIGNQLQPIKISRTVSASITLPALVTLGLFYSLAIHMRQTLGGWPEVIGTNGFPTPLLIHAGIAGQLFSIILFTGIFIWPIACIASAVNPRWRSGLPYLGIFAVSCSICFVAMMFGPADFVSWWWD